MGKFSQEEFLRYQREARGPVLTADLTGRVIIVTGANVGLGFEASKHFARMNPAKLILACRDQAKGDLALRQLTDETKFTRAEVWLLDVANFDSVKKFADRASETLERIDFLIENAGIATREYEVTQEGFEKTIQTNNLGPELLALLLLPKLLETARAFSTLPRIVVVASENHFTVQFSEDVINSPNIHKKLSDEEYCAQPGVKRYPNSKLLNVFFVRNLAARLPKSNPTVLISAVSPGYCLTELTREVKHNPAVAAHLAAMDKVAFTSEEGSRHIVYAALFRWGDREEEKKLQGQYFAPSAIQEPSDFVLGESGRIVGDKLWSETVSILGDRDGRIIQIVEKM